MLFSIETDAGSSLTGYLIPDSVSGHGTVRVRGRGADLAEIEATEFKWGLIESGRHLNGKVGFILEEAQVPGLAEISDLELLDAATGLCIYRRRPPETTVKQIVFRLETHLLPLWRLDDALNDKFHYWYRGIERYGRETSSQVFLLNHGGSSYVSGRLLYKNYDLYLGKGVQNVVMLRDPYDELAERLLVLGNLAGRGEQLLGARDMMIYESVISAAAELKTFDEAELRRFFNFASDAMIAALSNPLVRQLTTTTPDQMPGAAAVASALDVLSSFEIVGLRSDGEHFCNALADLAGLEAGALPVISEYSRVKDLGVKLRAVRSVERFLEKDLELYYQTTSAFERAQKPEE